MSYISNANLSFDSGDPLLENVDNASMNSLKSTSPPWSDEYDAIQRMLTLSYSVSINHCKQPMSQRIRRDCRDAQKLISIDCAGTIRIDLQKALPNPFNLLVCKVGRLHEVVDKCRGLVAHPYGTAR